MKKCKLIIKDQVNVTFQGLDPSTRRKCHEALKYFVPTAKFTSAYKLGRSWDGYMSVFSLNGGTYVNVLDKVLPIIYNDGYEIELIDHRPDNVFEFPQVGEDYFEKYLPSAIWPKGHPNEGEYIQLRDYQANIIKQFMENPQSVQTISTGAGKEQPLSAKIKTPDGWLTMGDMKVGTKVSTPCGGVANVIGVYPQGIKDVFNITLADGRSTRAGLEHLWKAYCDDWLDTIDNVNIGWRVVNTKTILNHLNMNKKVFLPMVSSELNNDGVILPIDPYRLGHYISNSDKKIFADNIEEYFILKDIGIHKNDFSSIPKIYELMSSNQKKEFLKGLHPNTFDYFNGVGEKSCVTVFCENLAKFVVNIIRSLGGSASYSTLFRKIEDGGNLHIIIYEFGSEINNRIQIRNIYRVGSEECQCIMIDSDDHLYITDDYIVTHNTIMTAVLSHICEKYGRSIVVVPNKSLVDQTEKDYKNVGLDVGVFYGDRKEIGKTHTICTWQSLEHVIKGTSNSDITMEDIIDDVVCVMIDECLDGDTLVTTPHGKKPIKDLSIGDKVISYDEKNNLFVEDTIIKVHTNLTNSSSSKMLEIVLVDGNILRITGNHKVLTKRGWVKAEDLTIEDEILDFLSEDK